LSIGVWFVQSRNLRQLTDSPAISAVSPDPAALRAYQEWEARLHATLSAGRETEAINAVTELTETRAASEFSPGYGKSVGPATGNLASVLAAAVHDALKQAGDTALALH